MMIMFLIGSDRASLDASQVSSSWNMEEEEGVDHLLDLMLTTRYEGDASRHRVTIHSVVGGQHVGASVPGQSG